jgi:hypothetical protein
MHEDDPPDNGIEWRLKRHLRGVACQKRHVVETGTPRALSGCLYRRRRLIHADHLARCANQR